MTLSPQANSHLCPLRQQSKRANSQRKGGIIVLLAILLPVIFIMAAFVINISYLQLARTELLIATDASARAAGRAWSHYQNIDDAKTAAQVTAALNTVGGTPVVLSFNDSDNDIEFGDNNISTTSNRFEFTKVPTADVVAQTQNATSVRINGKFQNSSQNGLLNSLFPGMGLKDQFQLHQTATATQLDRDIALVLDRSGSMSWITFDWPSDVDPWSDAAKNAAISEGIMYTTTRIDKHGRIRTKYHYTSGNDQTSYYQYVWEHHFNLGPAPQRPWDELVVAVNTFLDVLDGTDQNEQVSLATYSSFSRQDLGLVKDFTNVRNTLNSIGTGGSTAIGYGLDTGSDSLVASAARPYAAKTLIIMTDGMHNYGSDPITVATNVVNQYNFTIHTITFGPNADKNRMRSIAAIGGGKYYHAETGSELNDVFREIANNLPTLITQ